MRKWFRTEMDKLKQMNFTDKRQYIWEYYKLHLFFIGLILFFIGYLINVWFINPPKRDYVYIAWQAQAVHPEHLNTLEDRLSIILEVPERYRISVNSYVLVGEPQMDQALVTRFFAMLHVGDIHAIMASRNEMIGSAYGGIIRPIYPVLDALEELNPDLHDYIAKRVAVFTYSPEEDPAAAVTSAMGISLNDAPLLRELGFFTEDLYLCLIINSSHYYELAKVLVELFRAGGVE